MEGFAALLVMLFIGLVGAGPLAVILVIVIFKKLGALERRISTLESKSPAVEGPARQASSVKPVDSKPVWSGRGVTFEPVADSSSAVREQPAWPAATTSVQDQAASRSSYATTGKPIEIQPEETKQKPQAAVPSFGQPTMPPESPRPPMPVAPPTVQMPPRSYSAAAATKAKGGLELKIGTTVILIAGIITVIFGVGFFLKYVYEKGYFGPVARVAMVAAGGLVGVLIGEVLRRRNFEIVAKGITSLGFALLYAAVFSGARVYGLFSTEAAFALSILITAGAMTYAVVLNEIVIAFLSLLGGYLAPAIISTGQNLPVPLFSYVLTLSVGAMGCAMFRRWRAVNWITMVGTWFLYTAWFEKFYSADQMTVAMVWLSVFACLYLVLPILFGLARRVEARAEDVTLVVINGIGVFYYLWQILNNEDQTKLALATALLGLVHLAVMFTVVCRCRSDIKLQASLGVLAIAFITAAVPMHFGFQATLLGWAIEAVVLTFIGIRYRRIWTQVMAFLVAGIAAAGLFYHLPLHTSENFRVFVNAPFGTWLFVAAALLICHLFWRLTRQGQSKEAGFASQVFYSAGVLLTFTGLALEWHAHCTRHMIYDPIGQARFLEGMMVFATLLVPSLLARPVCPRGEGVRTVGLAAGVFGAVFVAIAMMGVYYEAFNLFVNIPFGLGLCFMAALFWAAWQSRCGDQKIASQSQLVPGLVLVGLSLFFILLTEQMFLYWSCRHTYAAYEGDWLSNALRSMFIAWAVYGLLLLFAGIRLQKSYIQQLSIVITGLSAIGLFSRLPLHTSAEFQLVYNFPFVTWAIVAAAILTGHGLWRFMRASDIKDAPWIAQFYYAAGLVLLALGLGLEWADHCRWHLEPSALARSHLHLGLIVLIAFMVQGLLARPLPPAGRLVKTAGVLAALGGCVYTAGAMMEVYYAAFRFCFNWPFAIAAMFCAGVLLSGRHIRRDAEAGQQGFLAGVIVLSALLLIWILLSEQVYSYWYCKDVFGEGEIPNWSFSAQMYMSLAWAIYAAVLMIIGFAARNKSIRWLSLVIFAILLAKIFILDTSTLRPEYRIAAFVTTGIILVGISFLYKLLSNRGFFDALENSGKPAINNDRGAGHEM